jgi:hypothetical protein
MNSNERRADYLAASRQQLRRELDEMGYGRQSRSVATRQDESRGSAGFVVTVATITALFVGLSISGLVA